MMYDVTVVSIVRSAIDANDDKLINLPSFLEAFASIITQLSQVSLHRC